MQEVDYYHHSQSGVAGVNTLDLRPASSERVLVLDLDPQPFDDGLAAAAQSEATAAHLPPTKLDEGIALPAGAAATERSAEWVERVKRLRQWAGQQAVAGVQKLQAWYSPTPAPQRVARLPEDPVTRAIRHNFPLPPIPGTANERGVTFDRAALLPTEQFEGRGTGTLVADEPPQPPERWTGRRLLPTYAVMAGALAVSGAIAAAVINRDPAAAVHGLHGIIQAGQGLGHAPSLGHNVGVLPSGQAPSIEGALGRTPGHSVERMMEALHRVRGSIAESSKTPWSLLHGMGVTNPGALLTRTAEKLHIPYQWHGTGKNAWFSLQEHGKMISSTKQVMHLLFGQRQLGS